MRVMCFYFQISFEKMSSKKNKFKYEFGVMNEKLFENLYQIREQIVLIWAWITKFDYYITFTIIIYISNCLLFYNNEF